MEGEVVRLPTRNGNVLRGVEYSQRSEQHGGEECDDVELYFHGCSFRV